MQQSGDRTSLQEVQGGVTGTPPTLTDVLFVPCVIHLRNIHQIHLDRELRAPLRLLKRPNTRTNERTVKASFLERFPERCPANCVTRIDNPLGKCPVPPARGSDETELSLARPPTERNDSGLPRPGIHKATILRGLWGSWSERGG